MSKTEEIPSVWYLRTKLTNNPYIACSDYTHCKDCKPSGECYACDTIDGRWVDAVNCYASTCDGCGELCHHDRQVMDPETQLGYCPNCIPELPPDVRERVISEQIAEEEQQSATIREESVGGGLFLWYNLSIKIMF